MSTRCESTGNTEAMCGQRAAGSRREEVDGEVSRALVGQMHRSAGGRVTGQRSVEAVGNWSERGTAVQSRGQWRAMSRE
jgi:hypothetical protein